MSPKNAPAIAEMLLDAGAEVDATAAVYGREYTTLGLIATSVPPHAAGVQIALSDILLQHGARMKFADDHHNLIGDCLANGQPKTPRIWPGGWIADVGGHREASRRKGGAHRLRRTGYIAYGTRSVHIWRCGAHRRGRFRSSRAIRIS